MFGKKKREQEKQLLEKIAHERKLDIAYINELKRKDNKYNFVFMPFVSVAEEKYQHLYVYGKQDVYSNGILINFITINDKVVAHHHKDQLLLSLKPGKYKVRVNIDIKMNLLNHIISQAERQNPGVTCYGYKDLYQCEVDKTCTVVVNEKDTAYILFKGKITPEYTRSKNLFYMESYSHSYEIRQTSFEHIESMIPNAFVDKNDQTCYKYPEIERCYIDEAYEKFGEELSQYKEVDIKPEIKPETKPNITKPTNEIYFTNAKYVGDIKNGLANGKGVLYYNNGAKFIGEFVNNKKHGNGVHYYVNGDKHEGLWENDLRHGKGVYTFKSGKIKTGEWANDVYVQPVTPKQTIQETPKVTQATNTPPIQKKEPEKKNESKQEVTPTPAPKKPIVNTKTEQPKNTKPSNVRYQDRELLPNGDFYTGSFLNGKFDGKGTMYYKDGTIYEGEWKDGKRHGKATYKNLYKEYFECEFINDVPCNHVKQKDYYGTYEGEWKNFRINGKGTFISKSNDKYVGEFLNGTITGKGVFTYSNGDKYEGYLVDGEYDGYGLFESNIGYKYEGMWKKGNHHGKGAYYYSDGKTKYEGDFVDGEYEGYGKYTMENAILEGEFKKGKLNGKGKISDSNGTYIEGDIVDNLCHGKGIKIYPNKDKYEGDFYKGKLKGKGVLTFNNGNKYEGEFDNNLFNGKGIYYYLNGTLYKGEWKDGKCHGKGYFYYTNGAIEELLYDNDKIISSKYLNEKQSSNMYIFKEIKGINIQNTFYAGEVINDIPNGFGIMLYPNGAYYIGQFEKGQNTGFGLYMDVNGKKAILGKFNNLQLNGVGLEANSNNTASFGNYLEGELIDEVRFINCMDYNFNDQIFNYNIQLCPGNGTTYFGGINNNYFHLAGVFCYDVGINYIGQYNNGYQNGLGIKVYPDGRFYIGMFEQDSFNGYGIFIDKDSYKVGYWENNNFIK